MALTGALALASADIHAQGVPDSLTAHRVRVHLARQDRALEGAITRQMLRGTMTRITPDSITVTIHPDAAPISVAVNGVYQVDVSRGVSAPRTALKRGLESALLASLLASLGYQYRDDPENPLIWAGGSFLLGAVAGFISPEERWKRVFHR